jgi:rhodanese-related sulfurtransferase
MKKVFGYALVLLIAGGLVVSRVNAADGDKGKGRFVGLTSDKPYIYVVHQGQSIKVERVQNPNYQLVGYMAKTSRPCPPHCLKPMFPASPDVGIFGEVELLDFMENDLRNKSGVLIDARTPSWFKKGTIPGAVNIPFTRLSKSPDSAEMLVLLKEFGGTERGEIGFFTALLEDWGFIDTKYKTETWDFTEAKDLVLFCNGASCGQSVRGIKGLLATGYPADKIKYYRGGVRMWEFWGLTTVIPETKK